MSLVLIDLDNIQEIRKVRPVNIDTVKIRAHHCTRAIVEDIKDNGLKIFDLGERLEYLKKNLLSYGISAQLIEKYEKEVREYISGMQLKGRREKICFCLNRELFEVDYGCDDFFKYFGGEAMYRIADCDSQFSLIQEALKFIGEPLVVTASISLRTAQSYQKDRIEQRINGQLTENCEVFIHENVPPEDILQIEVFNKDI